MRDDELLDALGRTLLPDPPAAPSGPEVRSFLAEVAAAPVTSPRPRRRLLPRFIAGGLAVALVGGGTAYAAGDGSRIPAPVRRAAVAIKLPVDSPEVADAKRQLADLEEAIGRGDARRIAKAIEDVDEALAELSVGERAAIDARVRELLALASTAVAASAPVATSAPAGSDDGAQDERDDTTRGTADDDDGDGSGERVDAAEAEDPDRDDEIDGVGEDNSGSGSATSDSQEPEPDDDHEDESDSSGSGSGSSGSGSSGSEEPDEPDD